MFDLGYPQGLNTDPNKNPMQVNKAFDLGNYGGQLGAGMDTSGSSSNSGGGGFDYGKLASGVGNAISGIAHGMGTAPPQTAHPNDWYQQWQAAQMGETANLMGALGDPTFQTMMKNNPDASSKFNTFFGNANPAAMQFGMGQRTPPGSPNQNPMIPDTTMSPYSTNSRTGRLYNNPAYSNYTGNQPNTSPWSNATPVNQPMQNPMHQMNGSVGMGSGLPSLPGSQQSPYMTRSWGR